MPTTQGCLEIGGSHVCVALVDPGTLEVTRFRRQALDSTGPLEAFAAAVSAALDDLAEPLPGAWAVALPGPFDYAGGVGGTHPSGKLNALAGRDVGALLRPLLHARTITFVNDALAFGIGSAADPARAGVRRVLGLTFGSGIGSAFVEAGLPVLDERVPPGGEVYALPAGRAGVPQSRPDGRADSDGTLEGRFGPAALAARHGCATFAELAGLARGDAAIRLALQEDFAGLADALGPWLTPFNPERVACGGGVVRAWDLFGDSFARRLALHAPGLREVTHEIDTEVTAMRGAVAYATALHRPPGDAVE